MEPKAERRGIQIKFGKEPCSRFGSVRAALRGRPRIELMCSWHSTRGGHGGPPGQAEDEFLERDLSSLGHYTSASRQSRDESLFPTSTAFRLLHEDTSPSSRPAVFSPTSTVIQILKSGTLVFQKCDLSRSLFGSQPPGLPRHDRHSR